ncbi:uncharacterized protein LOC144922146 [Branchiostoma floridae x Branchiostoma belcheri]
MASDDLVNWRLLLAFFLFGLNQILVIYFLKLSGEADQVSCGLREEPAVRIRRELRSMDDSPTSEAANSNRDDKLDTLKRADRAWDRVQNDLHEKGLEKLFGDKKEKKGRTNPM